MKPGPDYDYTAQGQIRRMAGEIMPDEPCFVVRGRDAIGAATVRAWAAFAKSIGVPQVKVDNALMIADAMDAWPLKQIPGVTETRVHSEDFHTEAGEPDVVVGVNHLWEIHTDRQSPKSSGE